MNTLTDRLARWPVLPLAGALFAAAAVVLYRFPPGEYGFYPLCPIHEYLHLACPGCGATRAFSALLHGQFEEAIHLNAFAVLVVLPLGLVYGAACLRAWRGGGGFRWPVMPRAAGVALAVAAVGFMIVRNVW